MNTRILTIVAAAVLTLSACDLSPAGPGAVVPIDVREGDVESVDQSAPPAPTEASTPTEAADCEAGIRTEAGIVHQCTLPVTTTAPAPCEGGQRVEAGVTIPC